MMVIDMDMPNNCAECPIHTDALSKVYCEITHKCVGNAVACYERMKKCPIKCDIEDIKVEIQGRTQRYTLARERCGMGQVDWSDYLIKADDVIKIIDKHISGDMRGAE